MRTLNSNKLLAPFLMTVLLAGCAGDLELEASDEIASNESAICHQPDPADCPHPHPTTPPHKGPPFPSANASGEVGLRLVRTFITQAFDDVIVDYNANHSGHLGWHGPKFSDCDSCKGTPKREAGWEQDEVYGNHVLLHYSGSRFGLPIVRDIDVPITIAASCAGWTASNPRGALTLTVFVDPIVGVQVSGGGWLEDFLDFFTVGHLSASIDNKVRAEFGNASSSTNVVGTCSSVGVYNPDGTEYDAIVWDIP